LLDPKHQILWKHPIDLCIVAVLRETLLQAILVGVSSTYIQDAYQHTIHGTAIKMNSGSCIGGEFGTEYSQNTGTENAPDL
jgi:hypothetical protein